MIHSVVSSTSALSAKVSLPSIVTPPSAGGLTSRITFLSLAMATLSPAAGTLLLGQVAGSDHFVALAAGAPRSGPGRQRIRRRAGMPEPAMQERPSDRAYSRN